MKIPHLDVLVCVPDLALGGAQKQALVFCENLKKRGLNVGLVLTNVASRNYQGYFTTGGYVPYSPANLIPVLSLLVAILERLSSFLKLKKSTTRRAFALFFTTVWNARKFHPNSDNFFGQPRLQLGALAISRIFRESHFKTAVSFLPTANICALIADTGFSPVTVVERNDFLRQPLSGIIESARLELYPQASLLAANSHNSVSQMKSIFQSKEVVYFPNEYSQVVKTNGLSTGLRTVAVVGRFELSKRNLETLSSFESSMIFLHDFELAFVGSGSLAQQIKDKVEGSVAASHTRFVDTKVERHFTFPSAAYIVLNSDYEGTPNVLIESVLNGCVPIVRSSVAEAEFIFGRNIMSRIGFASGFGLTNRFREMSERSESDRKTLHSLLLAKVEQRIENDRAATERLIQEILALKKTSPNP